MAHELVPYSPPLGNGTDPSTEHEGTGSSGLKPTSKPKIPIGSHNDPDPDQWNLPPVDARHSYFGAYRSAWRDYQEAEDAERHGDMKRARGRRQDAEENLQQIWDWGDLRTWLVIAFMFFFGIALACTAYVLPHGRDAAPPPIYVH